MTNCPEPYRVAGAKAFADLMAAQGLHDLRGVEMLRLVRGVNGAYEHVLAEHAGETLLSPHRWRVLFRIWLEEQQGFPTVNPTQLSRAHQVSKNTISEHLRALEDGGLIARELDADDRRQFKIRLTPAGRELILRSTPGHMQVLNQLLAGLSDDEIEQLTHLLAKLQQTVYGGVGAALLAKEGTDMPVPSFASNAAPAPCTNEEN